MNNINVDLSDVLVIKDPEIFNQIKIIKEYSQILADCKFENDYCKQGLKFGCCTYCGGIEFFKYDMFLMDYPENIESFLTKRRTFLGNSGCLLEPYKRPLPCIVYVCEDETQTVFNYRQLVQEINNFFKISSIINSKDYLINFLSEKPYNLLEKINKYFGYY